MPRFTSPPADVSALALEATVTPTAAAAAAIQAVTDLLPDAGALTSVKPLAGAAGAATQIVIPSLNDVSIASGAANVFGAWGQAIASTGEDFLVIGVTAARVSSGARAYWEVDIGVGAGAAEIVHGSMKKTTDQLEDEDRGEYMPLSVPIKVPSGSRLAMRVADSGAAANYNLSLVVVSVANVEAWDA